MCRGTHRLSRPTPADLTLDCLWTTRCHRRSRSRRIWPCKVSCWRSAVPEPCLSTWSRCPSPSNCAGFCGPAGCPGRGSKWTPSSRSTLRCYASCQERYSVKYFGVELGVIAFYVFVMRKSSAQKMNLNENIFNSSLLIDIVNALTLNQFVPIFSSAAKWSQWHFNWMTLQHTFMMHDHHFKDGGDEMAACDESAAHVFLRACVFLPFLFSGVHCASYCGLP